MAIKQKCHFRLMHPDLHEVIKQMVDLHLAWQFQQLKPEDFADPTKED